MDLQNLGASSSPRFPDLFFGCMAGFSGFHAWMILWITKFLLRQRLAAVQNPPSKWLLYFRTFFSVKNNSILGLGVWYVGIFESQKPIQKKKKNAKVFWCSIFQLEPLTNKSSTRILHRASCLTMIISLQQKSFLALGKAPLLSLRLRFRLGKIHHFLQHFACGKRQPNGQKNLTRLMFIIMVRDGKGWWKVVHFFPAWKPSDLCCTTTSARGRCRAWFSRSFSSGTHFANESICYFYCMFHTWLSKPTPALATHFPPLSSQSEISKSCDPGICSTIDW